MENLVQKIGGTAVLAKRLLFSAVLGIAVACSWLGTLDERATEAIDAGLKRALVSFAVARALNAAISLAQGTQFAAQPAGVGFQFSVGELMDPVNDLVEQLSTVMLTASVAFGIQKILVNIGAYWVVAPTLTAVAIAWLWLAWLGKDPPVWLSRSVLLLLIVRFAVPLVAVASDRMYAAFLAGDYAASGKVIESAKEQFAAVNPPHVETNSESSVLDRIKGWWSETTDIRGRIENLKKLAEQMTESIINQIVVFIMQTILLPIFLLWLLYRASLGLLASWPRTPT